MLNLNDIVNGLDVVKVRSFEDTRFVGDMEWFNDLPELINEFNIVELLEVDNELYIGSNGSNEPFVIRANKNSYMGEAQISWSIQELSLQGFAYYVKYANPCKDGVESFINCINNQFLKENGIDVDVLDLAELAIYESQFNVYILNFETNDAKYWITFRSADCGFKYLSKITRKPKAVPVKIKSKKLNINII